MLGLFYRIWVDCIIRAQSQAYRNEESWQTLSMLFMTLSMSSNFILIMTILEKSVWKEHFYKFDLSFLPTRLNGVLEYLFLFILPSVLINYLLIFRKNRYQKLMLKYPYYNGKLFGTYFAISMLLPIVLLLIGFIFFR
jgi:hypothetical protein